MYGAGFHDHRGVVYGAGFHDHKGVVYKEVHYPVNVY